MSEGSRPNEPGKTWKLAVIIFLLAGCVAVLWSIAAGIPEDSWSTFGKFTKDFGTLIIGAFGVIFLGWRTVLADRQSKLANRQSVLAQGQQHLAIENALFDQFQRGVAMLDSESESIRIAGLNTMNEVVKIAPKKYQPQAASVLRPFIARIPPKRTTFDLSDPGTFHTSEFHIAITYYENIKIDNELVLFVGNRTRFKEISIPVYMRFIDCEVRNAHINMNNNTFDNIFQICEFKNCKFEAYKNHIVKTGTKNVFNNCIFYMSTVKYIEMELNHHKDNNIDIIGCNISDITENDGEINKKSIIYFADNGAHFKIYKMYSAEAMPCWCWDDMIPANCSEQIQSGTVVVVSQTLSDEDHLPNGMPKISWEQWKIDFPQYCQDNVSIASRLLGNQSD